MSDSLKRDTLKAVFWNAVQRYGVLIISFLSNIVLARLLTPEDFGVIGLLNVFVAVAESMVDTGFGASLIQRKDTSNIDYSTVFIWNISVALLLTIVLLIAAPSISIYFNIERLSPVLRVASCIILVNALASVQMARLTKKLQFKLIAIRTLIAAIVSSITGIALALLGCGIWALVAQIIVSSVVCSVLIWILSKWKPSMQFSWASIKKMFNFGSMIFISGIFDTLYTNIQGFIIGKQFSVNELGYYTQAKKLESVPVQGTSSVLSQVLFPVYATVADDRGRHIGIVRKNVRIITFLTFPIMLLLIIIAHPLIEFLFSAKWLPAVPLFQILCVFGFLQPLNIANAQIFKAIGRGDIYFYLQTLKRIINIVLILLSVRFGLYAMMWTIALTGLVSYVLNIVFTHRVFGYSYREQFSDITPALVTSLVAMGVTYGANLLVEKWTSFSIIQILIPAALYIVIYWSISRILQKTSLQILKNILRRKL